MPSGRLILLGLILAAGGAGPGAASADDGEGDEWAALDGLNAALKARRSTNEEIVTRLDAVAGHYHEYDGGSDGEKARARYRQAAEKLIVKALRLQRIHRASGRNLRDGVNLRAAEVLGRTKKPGLSREIMATVDSLLGKAKYAIPTRLWVALFGALAALNDMDAFAWIVREFTHTRTTPPKFLDALVAAHAALVRFRDVPGNRRHEAVKRMVTIYAAVEASKDGKRGRGRGKGGDLWERVGPGVIEALQLFAGDPSDPSGTPLDTVAGFRVWFQNHRNPRRAPWIP